MFKTNSHLKQNVRFKFSILIVVFISICIFADSEAKADERKRILVINSYHPTYVWTKEMIRGIETTLADYHTSIELDIEYMDTKRVKNKKHYENLYNLYKHKSIYYDSVGKHPSVIIACDDAALLFINKHRDEFINDSIVFCGINAPYENISPLLKIYPSMTGILETPNYKTTLQTAIEFHPKARQIVVIYNEKSPLYELYKMELRKARQQLSEKLEFIDFSIWEISKGEPLKTIESLGDESIVLLLSGLLDPRGELYPLPEGIVTLQKRCTAAVYTASREWIELDLAVGGDATSAFHQGKAAVQMAMRILNGEKPEDIPLMRKGPSIFTFNYKRLKQFGISPSNLPKDSLVLNKPQSFYYKYKTQIYIVAAIITTLTATVIILSVNTVYRRQTERKVRHLAMIVEQAEEGVALAGLNGILQFVNRAWVKMHGYESNKQLVGKHLSIFHTEQQMKTEVIPFNEQVRRKGYHSGEVWHKRKDGTIFPTEMTTTIFKDEKNKPIGFIGFVTDMTEHKKAEEAFKESKEKFRDLVEITTDWAWEVDKDGVYTYVSPKVKDILGYEVEEVLGTTPFDLMPEKEAAKIAAFFEEKLVKGEPFYQLENTNRHKDGYLVVLETSGIPLFDSNGRVKGYRGIDRDITERKRAEQTLKEKQCLNELLLDSLPHFAMLIRKDRTILAANRLSRKMGAKIGGYCWMDFGGSEFIPQKDKEYINKHNEVPHDGTHCYFCLADEALENHKVANNPEIRIWDKILDTYWVPLGEDIFLHYAIDVTERKVAEQELQKAYDQLETRVEKRTAELADANKKLQAEIGGRKKIEQQLLIYQKKLRSLTSELSLAEERLRRQMAIKIHDNIGQNLAISKIKTESLARSLKSSEFAGTVEEILELLSGAIENSRSLSFELSPPVLYELGFEAGIDWLVRRTRQRDGLDAEFEDDGDSKPLKDNVRTILFQAVRELLVNVVKHAQAKKVKVSSQKIDNEINVIVEDDGVGFDASGIGERNYSGRGFGLFSIQERLGYIGGRVDIKSARGRGTKITLMAPLH